MVGKNLDKQEKVLSIGLLICGIALVLGSLYGWTISYTSLDKLMSIVILWAGALLIFLGRIFKQ